MIEHDPQPRAEAEPPHPHESEIAAALGPEDGVASYEDFTRLLAQFGFSHWKRGTYRTGTVTNREGRERTYLYMKPGAFFDDEPAARKFLEQARLLTARGVLLPDTRWRLVRHPSGAYAAVAVTRELQSPDGPEGADAWAARPKFKIEWLYERAGVDSSNMDAEFENPESFIHVLEPGETQHTNNWGWSPERKLHYPIDVEVVMGSYNAAQKASHEAGLERARAWDRTRQDDDLKEF